MKKNALMSLTAALAFATAVPANVVTATAEGCRILKQESVICSSVQYLTNVGSVARAESRIQAALQDALCLLEFPKCVEGTAKVAPVCWSVRDFVAKTCYEPFNHPRPLSGPALNGDKDISLAGIRDSLFPSSLDSRWARSADVQEPDCVSFLDHGLGAAPVDNIKVVNDLRTSGEPGEIDDYHRIIDQDVDAEQSGLFEYSGQGHEDTTAVMDTVEVTLKARHLSRRERSKNHHHHHNSQQKHSVKEKRDLQPIAAAAALDSSDPAAGANPVAAKTAPNIAIRADESGQSIYTLNKQGDSAAEAPAADGVIAHETLSHSETVTSDSVLREAAAGAEGAQKVLVQGGSGATSPETASESLEKANAGHPVDTSTTEIEAEKEGESHPKKGTVLLAAVPILLLMGAIAGFTVYRRYQENKLEQNRNDLRDDLSGDGYHRRDLPIRKGSPIHFDRTFLNTIHSPPPTATYLNDPENSSRHQSPSSVTSATNMKRPPPSAGSLGKTRFQELNRSYDFGAGFRSIKNALTRSTNTSRDSALDQASNNASSGTINNGKNVVAFGAGGHSLAKIGSHPGLNALERQQLQQQYGAGPSSAGSSGSRFPDMSTLTIPTEQQIVWGQYSANDDDEYQDAATAAASNLARKSASTTSLSMLSGGKYSHHHQKSSSHQPDTPTDSIGDCLSPESPSITREEMMRRRNLFAEGYAFGSEASVGDDAHSGSDLLFDARENFYDLGNEKAHDASLRDEEMDMYLNMEKEESPYPIDDFNTMNPRPYEPKVVHRDSATTDTIKKSARVKKEEYNEKKALLQADQKEAEADGEETHVLGSASPEWSGSNKEQSDENPGETFGEVQSALASISGASGQKIDQAGTAEVVDPAEWEEESRSSAKSSGALNQGQGSKKKGTKNKSKKGRKN
ncbi:hypothetical protein BGZ83_010239 [Gryganskiella cystojenkinii]|nr:hypothetical protein BGZ83_010239 [Gryganskiella cystojenkinii]